MLSFEELPYSNYITCQYVLYAALFSVVSKHCGCFVSSEKKREMGNNLYTAGDYAGAINSYQRYFCYD